jgi:periplasmic protein CpxP/Spy
MRAKLTALAIGTIMTAAFAANGGAFAQDQSAPDSQSSPPAATAPAQAPESTPAPRHAPNPHRQAKVLAKKLGLSAQQESQLEPILANRVQQVQSIRADTTLSPQEKRLKLRGVRQDANNQIEAMLTDSQKQQFEQMKQQQMSRHRQQQQQQQEQQPQSNAPSGL